MILTDYQKEVLMNKINAEFQDIIKISIKDIDDILWKVNNTWKGFDHIIFSHKIPTNKEELFDYILKKLSYIDTVAFQLHYTELLIGEISND